MSGLPEIIEEARSKVLKRTGMSKAELDEIEILNKGLSQEASKDRIAKWQKSMLEDFKAVFAFVAHVLGLFRPKLPSRFNQNIPPLESKNDPQHPL